MGNDIAENDCDRQFGLPNIPQVSKNRAFSTVTNGFNHRNGLKTTRA